jgi:hypothetical protein
MNRKTILRVLLVVAWIAAVTFLLRGAIRMALAAPLTALYQLLMAVYRATPQTLLWPLFIVAVFLVGVSVWVEPLRLWLLERSRGFGRPMWVESPTGRVAWLARWVGWRHHGPHSRHYLKTVVTDLLLNVLSHQQRVSLRQTRAAVEAGALALPPEVSAYARAGLLPWPLEPANRMREWAARAGLGRWVVPPDEETERVLDYIEQQLEGRGDER